MKLDSGGRGENGRFGVGIQRVERGDALLDFRFGKPDDAQIAREQALVMPSLARRGFTSASNSARSSAGTPGSRITMWPFASSQSPGAVPRGFGSTVAPSGTMAWRALISGMARPNRRNRSWMWRRMASSRAQLAAEQIGDGLARAVVVGGAEAAGGDDQFGALERVTKRRAAFPPANRRPPLCGPRECRADSVRAVRKREFVSSR